jgi:hypothetical protein
MKPLALLLAMALSAPLFAEVARPASDFTFPAAGGKDGSLKNLRGQPVVLVIADSAQRKELLKQLRLLEELYPKFANKHVVFAAALTGASEAVQSSIPFAPVNNPSAVAAAYQFAGKFQLVIIGRDGNIDYQTEKVCLGERVRDVIQNSFVPQNAARR